MSSNDTFHYEIATSKLPESEVLDSRGDQLTIVKCHGRLVIETRDQIEQIFKDHPFHGRVVMDLSDVSYIDSAGLGALIRLKMSAIKESGVSVEFVEMTPRIMQLLRITNLTEWFSS
jgi:anti-anti-sigma factor